MHSDNLWVVVWTPLFELFSCVDAVVFNDGKCSAGNGEAASAGMKQSAIGALRCRPVRCWGAVATARAEAALHRGIALLVLIHPCFPFFLERQGSGSSPLVASTQHPFVGIIND